MGMRAELKRWLRIGRASDIQVLVELEEGEQAADGEGRWVDVLRVGRFEDRLGREVEITGEDLDAYVANFEAGAAGQEVPIDQDHERKAAAGWVRSLRRVGDVVQFLPDWNELGRTLVGDKVYRYVSATLDLVNRVFKAVSLVNFPAIKGLQPVELANGQPGSVEIGQLPEFYMYSEQAGSGTRRELGDSEEVSMSEDERARIRAELEQELRQQAEERDAELAEARRTMRVELRAEIEAELAERRAVAEFAAQVCSGEGALGEQPDVVAGILLRVPADVRAEVERLLSAPRVPLGEIGSGREGRGELQELPAEFAAALDRREIGLADLESPVLGLEGAPGDYDLSRWQG